jgi:hypothetical protein
MSSAYAYYLKRTPTLACRFQLACLRRAVGMSF